MWNKVWVMACVLFVTAGCGTKKIQQISTANNSSNTTIAPNVAISNLDFHTFSGRAKSRVEFGNDKQDATLNIRMDRDKAIWISVTASFLNIEGVRVLITPDSIKILNKLQGEYIVKPFSYVHRYTGAGVTFDMLQNLLIANVSNELLRTEQLTVAQATDETQVVGVKDNLSFQYSLNKNQRPKVFRLVPLGTSNKLEVLYGAFNKVTGYDYPQKQNIKLDAPDMGIIITLEYNKLEFNQLLEMPLSVPAKYKVIR